MTELTGGGTMARRGAIGPCRGARGPCPPLPRVERRLRAAVRALLGAVWLAVLLFAARALLW